MRISLVLSLILLACSAPTNGTDAGRPDAAVSIDAAAGSDAGVVPDAGDVGMCLTAATECLQGGTACCAPTTCVVVSGDGQRICRDETGCVSGTDPCDATHHCCGSSACTGGVCLATP